MSAKYYHIPRHCQETSAGDHFSAGMRITSYYNSRLHETTQNPEGRAVLNLAPGVIIPPPFAQPSFLYSCRRPIPGRFLSKKRCSKKKETFLMDGEDSKERAFLQSSECIHAQYGDGRSRARRKRIANRRRVLR